MKENILSFGEPRQYKWKYIEIDYPVSIPILLNNEEVGAFLAKPLELHGGLQVVEMHGIEVEPQHRRKGVAEATVHMLLQQCDMMIGSITEDQPKPFWLHMGAQFRPIPLDAFGDTINTVHTKEPVFFFITKNPLAAQQAEWYAKNVPDMMRKFNSLDKKIQKEIMLKHGYPN